MEASPVFLDSGSNNPKELDALERLSTEIQNLFIEISKMTVSRTTKRLLE